MSSATDTGREQTELRLAASYARKSTEDQEGLRAQHLRNEQRARSDGYLIPPSADYRFEDDDTTGVSKRRSGLDRLIQIVTSGQATFDRVYVKDRTRLGRWSDPRYGFYLEVLLEQHGVSILYSERERHVDYDGDITPDAIGLFLRDALDGIVAAQERERLIRRVTEGMRYWVLRGFFPGSLAPYGLERWLADEKTGVLLERVPDGQAVRKSGCRYRLVWAQDGSREVIRDIYRLIEEGESLAAIAAELNARNTPTPSGRGKWRRETVRRIARNPIYCGDLVWGRTTRDGEPVGQDDAELDGEEAILVRDFLPDAPVSREQWEDVQRILNGNRETWNQRRATAPDYLLSGLVRCSGCGAGWHGFTSTRTERTRRRYYRHGKPPDGAAPCPAENRYIRTEEIEGQVLRTVAHVLEDGRLQELTAEAIRERLRDAQSVDHEKRIAETERLLERHERALRKMVRDRAMATTDVERQICQEEIERLVPEVEHLRYQLRSLTEDRAQLEALATRRSSLADRACELLELVTGGTAQDRKEVVAAVVQRVEIDPQVRRATIAVRAL